MQGTTAQGVPKKGSKKNKKRNNQPDKTPPKRVPVEPTQRSVYQTQRSVQTQRSIQAQRSSNPPPPGMLKAKERAKADAVFASTSSQWYAGAAFDRSPAANTLPKPTLLLDGRMGGSGAGGDGRMGSGSDGRMGSGSDGRMGSGADGRMGSGADGRMGSGADGRMGSGAGDGRMGTSLLSEITGASLPSGIADTGLLSTSCPTTTILSDSATLVETDLRQKSRDLLKLLKVEKPQAVMTDTVKNEELEEMTRQVRRLLNMS